jgi:hypothetical protein
VAGQEGTATVDLGFSWTKASETDLLGRKLTEVSSGGSRVLFPIQPWKIRTFAVT